MGTSQRLEDHAEQERMRTESQADVPNQGTPNVVDSLRLHRTKYLMEAGHAGFYPFSACAVATP